VILAQRVVSRPDQRPRRGAHADEACEAILDAPLGEEPPYDDVALLVMRISD
jgi:hypothetical protein